jgi:hypothetical protein
MAQITFARPPVEVEVSARSSAPDLPQFTSALAGHIRRQWGMAKTAKQPILERLIACDRQRNGEYHPKELALIREFGGSEKFMMITDVKCRAATAWIRDVHSTYEQIFDIMPARVPDLPPEVSSGIVEIVMMEMQEFIAQGHAVHPAAARMRTNELRDQIVQAFKTESEEAARRMSDVISDQLIHGKWKSQFNDFIDDFVTYPTAVMKGPVVKRRKQLEWGENWQPIVTNNIQREVVRVSPYDIFPSPNASSPHEGFIIERHRFDAAAISACRGNPGYSDREITQVLERYGVSGFRETIYGDQTRDELAGKHYTTLYNEGVIDGLEFWGPVMGNMLISWGMEPAEEIDPLKVYDVNAICIAGYVIKAIINPDPQDLRPYEIASFAPVPGAFWGKALPELMSDVQALCNSAVRAMDNNMRLASGPMMEVTADRLADGEDISNVYPMRIWQTTSDRTGGGQPAVRFFQPQMMSGELLNIYNHFSNQADEVTGIPRYLTGAGVSGGAGRTSSGLSMLMEAASKGIKQAILAIDAVIEHIVRRYIVHNMLYNPDQSIKGDFKVQARGALGLIQRETQAVRRNEFLVTTLNPIDSQIMGPAGRAYLLREQARGLNMDVDKLVPDPKMLPAEMHSANPETGVPAWNKFQQAAQQLPNAQQLAPATTDNAGAPMGQGPQQNLMQ